MESELSLLKAAVCRVAESPVLNKLDEVWQEMGLTEEHRETRREAIQDHIIKLVTDIVDEEIGLKDSMVFSVEENKKQLEDLCQTLSLPVELPSSELSLQERERKLREQVDALNKLKFDRLKRLKRLAEMEVGLCKTLGEKAQLTSMVVSKTVPSEQQLEEFRAKINGLEKIRSQRLDHLMDIQEQANKIWAELECEPSGELAKVHSNSDIKTYIFSAENMEKLEDCYRQLEDQVVELQAKAIKLRAEIASLWERLDISQEERDLFNSTKCNQGHTTKSIAKLEAELQRLNELKKQNMAKFIQATRDELSKIWDKCYYGDGQRREFAPAFTDDFTDDMLSAHESELDRMRGFYKDNQDVFKLVEKRENLWKQFLELEEKDNNPDRLFNTRGGQLLKDQKLKQQLRKDLPKVEKELKTALGQWEDDHERYFVISDTRYLDTIAREWEERDQQKQKEKIKRQKVKVETTVMEMTYGSRPNTPRKILKRTAASPLAATAPIKVRKVYQSPLVRSTTTNRPPHSTRAKKIATKGGGGVIKQTPVRPTQKRLSRNSSRKILAERNASVATDDSLISHTNESLASTCSSYTDFQRGLMQGFGSAKTARSSAIPRSSSMDNVI